MFGSPLVGEGPCQRQAQAEGGEVLLAAGEAFAEVEVATVGDLEGKCRDFGLAEYASRGIADMA